MCKGSNPASTIDYSKSYINVTKLATGGGVEPGDILEIRATFVVLGGTVDSVTFYDTLQSNKGYKLISGNIATQTNEGKYINHLLMLQVMMRDGMLPMVQILQYK